MSVIFHLVAWKVYSYFPAFPESDMCLLWIWERLERSSVFIFSWDPPQVYVVNSTVNGGTVFFQLDIKTQPSALSDSFLSYYEILSLLVAVVTHHLANITATIIFTLSPNIKIHNWFAKFYSCGFGSVTSLIYRNQIYSVWKENDGR